MPLDNNTPDVRNNPKPVESGLTENAAAPEKQKEVVAAAHEAALNDIEQDPDVNMKAGPEADLDEGEIARFEDGDDVKGRPAEEDPLAT